MKKVIGYGPKADYSPFFPVILLLEENGKKSVYRHPSIGPELNNEVKNSDLSPFMDRFVIFESPKDYRENHWLAIEPNGIIWFLAEDSAAWRKEKADSLLKQGTDMIKSNPTRALQILDSAGRLARANLKELISQLESKRVNERESLEDIYGRNRE